MDSFLVMRISHKARNMFCTSLDMAKTVPLTLPKKPPTKKS